MISANRPLLESPPSIRTGGLLVLLLAFAAGGCANHVGMNLPAMVVFKTAPNYPFEMARAGIKGEVRVRFVVGTDGVPRDIAVVHSSRPEFEKPALAAVAKWRFRPATVNDQAVASRMEVPLSFDPGVK